MAPISDIERQVYSNIYERYSQKLLGICLGYVHDIDVAKDILHDAFIIIFSRIGTLREPEKIEQWMCAIARNLSLKHIEKEKKFSGTDVSELNEIHEEEAAATGIEAIPFEDLIKAIDELPTQYGKVFRLSVLEGLSHQEIGEMLGIAPHSSSSNLARAKQLLRKIINRNWGILITFLVLLFAIFHFTGREDIAVEYEEEWYKEQASPQLKGAAYTAQCEQALMQELDDEFKEDIKKFAGLPDVYVTEENGKYKIKKLA